MTNHLQGDVQAILLYKKICNAFDLVEKWDENASRQFLSQILDIGDLLDHTCKTLVENIIVSLPFILSYCEYRIFQKLKWTKVPMDLRMRWRNLLCEIGVKHVVHLEKIYQCAIRAFLPEESVNGLFYFLLHNYVGYFLQRKENHHRLWPRINRLNSSEWLTPLLISFLLLFQCTSDSYVGIIQIFIFSDPLKWLRKCLIVTSLTKLLQYSSECSLFRNISQCADMLCNIIVLVKLKYLHG